MLCEIQRVTVFWLKLEAELLIVDDDEIEKEKLKIKGVAEVEG